MKTLLIAAGLLTIGTTFASAQEWRRDQYPYAREHHEFCQRRARELWGIERDIREHRAGMRERETARIIEGELAARCGGWRWRG
jgi:hypothetical protein